MSAKWYLLDEKTIVHCQDIVSIYLPFYRRYPPKDRNFSAVLFSLKKWIRVKHLKQKEVQKQDICEKNPFSSPFKSIH